MNNEAIATAAVLGTLAFNNGRQAAPCQDENLMKLIEENSTGMGSSIPLLDAWSKAWHAANIAA